MYVIVISSAFSGLVLLGPFDDFDVALKYAEDEFSGGEWLVVKIEAP